MSFLGKKVKISKKDIAIIILIDKIIREGIMVTIKR